MRSSLNHINVIGGDQLAPTLQFYSVSKATLVLLENLKYVITIQQKNLPISLFIADVVLPMPLLMQPIWLDGFSLP